MFGLKLPIDFYNAVFETAARLGISFFQIAGESNCFATAIASAPPAGVASSRIVKGKDDQAAKALAYDIDNRGHERLALVSSGGWAVRRSAVAPL